MKIVFEKWISVVRGRISSRYFSDLWYVCNLK